MALDPIQLTALLMAIVAGLGSALIWLFWDLERRIGKRFAPATLARFGYRSDGTRDKPPKC